MPSYGVQSQFLLYYKGFCVYEGHMMEIAPSTENPLQVIDLIDT